MPHAIEGEGKLRDLDALRIARTADTAGKGRNPLVPALGAALVLLVLAIAGYEIYSRTIGRPLEVEVAPVTLKSAGQSGVLLTGSGYIITRDKYITIGSKVLGQIVEEPIEEGKHVQKGDVLAKIDDRDYQAQLKQAKADYDLAVANLNLAQAQTRRVRKLYGVKVASRDELDKQVDQQAVAAAQVERAKGAIDFAQFMVDQCVIKSPIDGVVLKKFREIGATVFGGVQAGGGSTDIAELASTDNMRVELDINESDISKVTMAMPATIVPDAYSDRTFEAKVVKIYPEADRQKGTVRVEVEFLNPDMTIIKPEMNTKVSFLAAASNAQQAPMVLVPKKAVVGEGSSSSVWIVRDGYASRVPVQLGREFQGGVEVKHGLSGGELVILGAPEGLKDNQPVATKSS